MQTSRIEVPIRFRRDRNLGAASFALLFLLLLAISAKVQAQEFNYTTNNGTITITKYIGSGGAVFIPDTINNLPVTCIGTNAFRGSPLTSVTLPDSVTNLGARAFFDCTNLASIVMGNSLTSLGDWAFYNCTGLTSVTLPNSVTSIGFFAFQNCSNLTSVTLPTSVTRIGDYMFYNCTSLTSVTLPTSVTSIGSYAFYGCSSLTSVTFPTSVTSIGNFAFRYCRSVINVTVPSSVTNIGNSVFSDCSSLTAITVDALNLSYSSVAGVLFNNSQSSLIQYPAGKAGGYTIPSSTANIGEYAFSGCSSLTSVAIGNSVTNIGNYAFLNCTGLTSGTIGDSVVNIGEYAFFSCTNLTRFTLGNRVTSIGYAAFFSCSGLTGVYFKGNAPPSVGLDVFYNANNAIVYYLPGTTGWGPTFGARPTVLWNPQIQTSDIDFGVQPNRFGFPINGTSGLVIVVEACTDLANPIWAPVGTNILSGGSSYFSDPQWTNFPARFYRLRSP